MSSPHDLGRLDTTAWERLQDLAERLEIMWREQGPVDLNAVLPPVGDPARFPFLVELIKTDLEIRWRRNQGVRLDWYVERFEELGAVSELSARLIYEEFRVRQLHGDKPDLSSYKRRFPRQFPEVEQLVMAEPIGTVSPALPTPVTPPSPAKGPGSIGSNVVVASEGYRLIERIGTGSFGEVWRAEAPGGVLVAVKIIYRPVGSDADQHEKKAIDRIKNLSHPFLLGTHTYWIGADGRLHIVMDLADGTLRDRLKDCLKRGQAGIPPEELLRQMNQSAQALDYVHGEGLYHRDIKPDNILLKKGFAKVGDFSLVRNQETLSIDSAAAGTLAYMGPECFRGNVVKQSDQYSLAVTYIELRTNRRPFPTRTNWYDAMLDAVEGTPEFGTLEGPERAALTRALAKKPEDRFSSCLAFVEALETAIKGEPAPLRTAEPESWLQSGRRVGPDGHQLLRRLSGSSTVGQFWEAVAPGGKHVALQIIENLDRGGVLKHLRAYDLAHCFAGAANILQVYGNWQADTRGEVKSLADILNSEAEERIAFVVAQALADDDLAHRLGGSRRKLSDERLGQLLTYLRQAALALDHMNSPVHTYARRKQLAIRHCSIRPEHLMLVGDEVRIAHFDLAQEVTEPVEPLRVDSLDLEPGYAAPELLERGGGQVTAFSDQYSLAMTYVKLRTGSLPFDQSQSRNRIIDEQLDGKLNLKSLPERERPIITKATARRPQERYPSCAAMIAALEAVCRVSQPEIVVEPPSVQEETLEKKPPTHQPVIDRPTPARGNWRVQGLGQAPETDLTLRPGQNEATAESVFEPHVPQAEKRPQLPRRESAPRLPRRRPGSRAMLAIALLIALVASFGLAALAGKLWQSEPEHHSPVTQKDHSSAGRPEVDHEFPPAYEKPLQEFRDHIEARQWQKGLAALAQLRENLPPPQDEAGQQQVAKSLETAAKSVRGAGAETKLTAETLGRFIDEYRKFPFPIPLFDLVWKECKLHADSHAYEAFLATLAKFNAMRIDVTGCDSDFKELFDPLARPPDVAKLLTALAGKHESLPAAIENRLSEVQVRSVNAFVKERLDRIENADAFRTMLHYIEPVIDQKNGVEARTVACHVESLLRGGSVLLAGEGDNNYQKAVTFRDHAALKDSTDSYVLFVRGLLLQSEEKWEQATKHYDHSFALSSETWQSVGRKSLAAEAYYKAASQVWKGGKDPTGAKDAVKYFQGAAKLVALMPVLKLTVFIKAAQAAQNVREFDKRLIELCDHHDLRTLSSEARFDIAAAFAARAEGNPDRAVELLRKVGPRLGSLFRALAANERNGESLDYWLGRYEWEFGEKSRAKQAFGRALAESEPSRDLYERGRLELVEESLGKFAETESPEHWLDVFRVAVPNSPKARSERQWELLVPKYRVIAENREMEDSLFKDLKDADTKILRDLQELIAYGAKVGRTDLPIEARLLRLTALNKFMKTATYQGWPLEKQMPAWEQVKKDYHELSIEFSTGDIFKAWKRRDKVVLANKIAGQLDDLAQAARKSRLTKEAADFEEDSKRIKDGLTEYQKGQSKPAGDGDRSLRRQSPTAVAASE
jgi:serine/threonine protein kinase